MDGHDDIPLYQGNVTPDGKHFMICFKCPLETGGYALEATPIRVHGEAHIEQLEQLVADANLGAKHRVAVE